MKILSLFIHNYIQLNTKDVMQNVAEWCRMPELLFAIQWMWMGTRTENNKAKIT